METFHSVTQALNAILWHDGVLYAVLATGVLFTVWSVSMQYRALTHGFAITAGRYDNPHDPGAINHFQALSTALSATVGLGNIGGVAIALALGGPGALFWMWIVGLIGMAVKTVEVTLAMLYRNVDDPDNPHGGPMWVAKRGFAEFGPGFARFGAILGGFYCVTLLVGAFAGGNMFQAWNVADLTHTYFGVSKLLVGMILMVTVAMVLLGGIRRIGHVTGALVPFMCALYIIAGLGVVILHIDQVPGVLALVVKSAFSPIEATGAFVGGSVGAAMLWGMKRALFSSEVGQGSSAIAHAAVKTDEPVREGLVAGLEPFIDTLVVCTITALVILTSGVWNRGPDAPMADLPRLSEAEPGIWISAPTPLSVRPDGGEWPVEGSVFAVADVDGVARRIPGTIAGGLIAFDSIEATARPQFRGDGVYQEYAGASLTALAFNQTHPDLGKYLVTLAAWLFAISTIISWGYYGEQAVVYLFGVRGIMAYKVVYCLLVLVATLGFIRTDREIDAITTTGTGLVLLASLPTTLILGYKAVAAYREYIGRLKSGNMPMEHEHPHLVDVISGRDVEDERDDR